MRKPKYMLQAVIFDMDGVITNSMPEHFYAWKKIFAGLGICVTHLDIYKREGQRGIYSVKEIFKEKDRHLSEDEAKRILGAKEKLFKQIVKTRFIPGARGFLHFLSKKGLKLALVTGTSRHEVRKILPADLYGIFDVAITGSDVNLGKPHPEPFIKALKELRINSRAAVVIENAPFGIRSAKAAGLKCFALTTSLSREYLKGADRIFSSIKEMQGEFKSILLSVN